MRKQTKIAAITSAAALLAIGASMTAFAAGWKCVDEATNSWVYEDADGYRVENEWKKWPANGQWCYLGDDGICVAETLVPYETDGGTVYYYVDASGYRVLNTWVYLDNEDGIELNGVVPYGIWYRFGSSGRAITGRQDKVDGKLYRFDEEGHMLAGWYEGGYYYNDAVDESDSTYGQAPDGWTQMIPQGDVVDDQDIDTVWYYFKDGKYLTGDQYISKTWWHFDDSGILKSGWQKFDTPAPATDNNAGTSAYFDGNNGKQKSGWIFVKSSDDKGPFWYYVDSYGRPTVASSADGTANGDKAVAIRVKGKTYLLGEDGRMLDGLKVLKNVQIVRGGTGTLNGTYYFSKDDWSTGGTNGAMVLNTKKVVYDDYDNGTEYYFSKTGEAYANAIVGNSYYNSDGEKVLAKYEDYEETTVKAGTTIDKKSEKVEKDTTVLVSSNGTIVKNRTISNVEGYKKYYVGKLPSANDLKDKNVKWFNNYNKDSKEVATEYDVTCYVY